MINIDIHSHILPGIDDGSKSMEMSIQMLKMAEAKGTKTIVATPHYMKSVYENYYDDVSLVHQQLKLAAASAGVNIEILLGQEIMLDKYSLKLCKEKKLRGINGTNYLLIEFPMEKLPKDAIDLIYELRVAGIKPIVAHPERYDYINKTPTVINDFIEEGCLFQINTGSLEGLFGKKVQSCAKMLVEERLANFIASDAHTLNKRCPGLLEGVHVAKTLDKGFERRVSHNLELLLKNEDVEIENQKIAKKKNIFNFFKG